MKTMQHVHERINLRKKQKSFIKNLGMHWRQNVYQSVMTIVIALTWHSPPEASLKLSEEAGADPRVGDWGDRPPKT